MTTENSASTSDTDTLAAMLAEHQVLYALVQFRMASLDRRVPLAGGTIAAFLAATTALTEPAQWVFLIALPIALIWHVRTTLSHARGLEDAIRRIEQVECCVNEAVGDDVLRFQSHHPSRLRTVGGRTSREAASAVFLSAVIMLIACVYLLNAMLEPEIFVSVFHAAFCLVIFMYLSYCLWSYHSYRYLPRTPSST